MLSLRVPFPNPVFTQTVHARWSHLLGHKSLIIFLANFCKAFLEKEVFDWEGVKPSECSNLHTMVLKTTCLQDPRAFWTHKRLVL